MRRYPVRISVMGIINVCDFSPEGRGSISCRGKIPLFSKSALGPNSILYNRYQAIFHRGQKRPAREALHSTPSMSRPRMMALYLCSPICLYCLVLN
jgi:hypothetical protein